MMSLFQKKAKRRPMEQGNRCRRVIIAVLIALAIINLTGCQNKKEIEEKAKTAFEDISYSLGGIASAIDLVIKPEVQSENELFRMIFLNEVWKEYSESVESRLESAAKNIKELPKSYENYQELKDYYSATDKLCEWFKKWDGDASNCAEANKLLITINELHDSLSFEYEN